MRIKLFQLLCLFCCLCLLGACNDKEPTRILVFSKTSGFRHACINDGKTALVALGEKNGIAVDTTDDATAFVEDNLKRYSAVVFLNTTGDVLDAYQQADFERFIQAGGGFVGIHSATDTEYDWPWYNQLVGGYFNGHPKVQAARLVVEDRTHPSTEMLEEEWMRTDEWYNFKSLNSDVTVLIRIDEKSYEGGGMGEDHPMAWYHEYDGGRSFYTGLGHTKESFSEDLFLQHLEGGIRYAIGQKPLDYRLATTHRVPPENRFVRKVLWRNLREPMELDVFEDGKVIVVERGGRVLLWDTEMKILDSIAGIPVHTKYEDGLLGVAIDPNYATNKWVYFCYSPVGDIPKQHISRFVLDNGKLDVSSEKVLLEVPVQRDECCHSGGSLEFGPDGNLFITIGDNTNPFASDGFSPSDERPGREPWDAQRTSANTNDLRGKILRIRPEADGTYSIPEGNLFPPGTPNTRPEIYVMGCRNPFRHAIDHQTGYLYWGDVGPDAGKNKDERGPKGIDEVNQARAAGNWGWPYSRGNNQRYHDYNFAQKVSGPLFDPQQPINESPNNTGKRVLPPAQQSMIWYSYDESKEFPWTGVGGKNPMAGPIYHSNQYKQGAKSFPPYFDGKLLIYEWMRNWIYVVKMDEKGQMLRVDPFMPNESFSRPMDMVFGPDGSLYVLEYGKKWFAANLDARLSRIEFVRGNRQPVPKIEVDQSVGSAPMVVQCSAAGSYDFDEGDELRFIWKVNGKEVSREESPSITFDEVGIFQLELKAVDKEGRSATASQEIQVGNAAPEIAIELAGGNRSFFPASAQQLAYKVAVKDAEDGSTQEGKIAAEAVRVTLDYMEMGFDMTTIAQGHQSPGGNGNLAKGKKLIAGSDCKTCHAAAQEVNGPSYQDIAKRYNESESLVSTLAQKIIAGGSGTWGERAMSAHPQISEADAKEMVRYILSLDATSTAAALPLNGSIPIDASAAKRGSYVLMVSYTDKGNGEIQPITSRQTIRLRSPKVEAEDFNESSFEAQRVKSGGDRSYDGVARIRHEGFLQFNDIDLHGVQKIRVKGNTRNNRDVTGKFEIWLDGLDGTKLGEVVFKPSPQPNSDVELSIPIEASSGLHDLLLVMKNDSEHNRSLMEIDWLYFDLAPTL
ncbi:MAG: ThuA domain-containing protein [Bacteroidota bacterium]